MVVIPVGKRFRIFMLFQKFKTYYEGLQRVVLTGVLSYSGAALARAVGDDGVRATPKVQNLL